MANLISITSEELYDAIWSKPAITVAKDYGISDVAVAKISRKLYIPKPSLGYGAKKQYGKRVRQKPLPPLKPDTPDSYTIHPTDSDELPKEIQDIIDRQRDFENDEANLITVKESLRGSHSLVSRHHRI